jgi:NADH-quinone oxidoreductase subunit J
MSFDAILFYALAGLTGVCSVGVVVSQNIVRAAAWLLFALAGVAGVFFLLDAQFVGATQILVYVGGTLVLVVFGVMLTAQGPFIRMRIGAGEWAVAGSVGLLLYAVLAVSLLRVDVRGATPGPMAASKDLGLSFIGSKDPESLALAPPYPPGTPGLVTGIPPKANNVGDDENTMKRPRTSYLLPFEIVSIHLLVVLIAAAYLARAKRRRKVEG